MVFETLNSVYKVDVTEEGKFQVTKIEELAESRFNVVGVPRVSSCMSLAVGDVAWFDTWHTSTITKIRQEVVR